MKRFISKVEHWKNLRKDLILAYGEIHALALDSSDFWKYNRDLELAHEFIIVSELGLACEHLEYTGFYSYNLESARKRLGKKSIYVASKIEELLAKVITNVELHDCLGAICTTEVFSEAVDCYIKQHFRKAIKNLRYLQVFDTDLDKAEKLLTKLKIQGD